MSRIHNWQRFLLLTSLYAALVACQGEPNDTTVGDQGNTPATQSTIRANASVAKSLDLDNPRDFEDASRGLIATPDSLLVSLDDGAPAVFQAKYGLTVSTKEL